MRRRDIYRKGDPVNVERRTVMPMAEKMLEIPKVEKKRGRPKKGA